MKFFLQYLYQIDLRIIVVDIIELNVHNVTLEYMVNYRSEKYAHLPEHDLAILISNAYEGGIAYVNGICSRSAVGIIGVSFRSILMEKMFALKKIMPCFVAL